MKILLKIVKAFGFIVIFALSCLFVAIYASPISSKVAAKIVSSVLEYNLPRVKIEISKLDMDFNGKKVSLKIHDISAMHNSIEASLGYVSGDIDLYKVLTGKYAESISNLSLSHNIKVKKLHAEKSQSNNHIKQQKNISNLIAKFLRDNIESINNAGNLIKQINFNFSTKGLDEDIILKVSDFRIIENEVGIFAIDSEVKANNDIFSLDLYIDTNSKYVDLTGEVKFFPITLLLQKFADLQHIKGNLKLDLAFRGKILEQGLANLEFNLKNYYGLLEYKDYLSENLILKKLLLSGKWSVETGLQTMATIIADDITLNISIKNYNDILLINADVNEITLKKGLSHWPKTSLPLVRSWIADHLKKGLVKSINTEIKMDLNNPVIQKESLNISVKLRDAIMNYMGKPTNVPPLYIKEAEVLVTGEDVLITLKKAALSGQQLNDSFVKGLINYKEDDIKLVLNGSVYGSIQDAINLAFAHGNLDSNIKGFKGDAITEFAITIPLEKDFEFNEDTINITSVIKNASNKDSLGSIELSRIYADAKLRGAVLEISGNGKINDSIDSDFKLVHDIIKDHGVKIDLKLRSVIEKLKQSGFVGFDWLSGSLSGDATVFFVDGEFSANSDINLTDAAIDHPLGVKKASGVNGQLKLNIKRSGEMIEIPNYNLQLPHFKSEGSGSFSDYGLKYLSSTNSSINKNNFGFEYKIDNDLSKNLNVYSDIMDLSGLNIASLLKASSSGSDIETRFKLTTQFKKVILRDGIIFFNPEIRLDCRGKVCQDLVIKGNLTEKSNITIYYSYPVISIVSDSIGEILIALGIYDNFRGGKMEFKGEFGNDEIMRGKLLVSDYNIRKIPLLAKLISTLTSINTIGSLNGKGLNFRELHSKIAYDHDRFFIEDLTMLGSSFDIKCSSTIEVKSGKILGEGVIAPENIINKSIKYIPIIGQIVSGSSGFIAAHFSLYGNIDNVNTLVNPFSVIMPGFLNDFFNKEKRFKRDQKFPEMLNKSSD